ncbi:hypothetical protein PVAND_007079 [Polypedilum vanderplanki]|uniref:acylphosphatase n=1 Tax=Polypedilum vanderplanki TaxID=319348 RepID=A0A9J6C6R9_POLVA|nr:hypothetical protein PVAND_007079 [Polypedilum vanderplanki]
MSKLVSCEFEVFGKVQGVYFRKYTEKQAIILGLRGWCMNTENNSVKGRLEGDKERIMLMREWLKTTGSPKSNVERACFTECRPIREFTVRKFSIKR